MDSCKEVANIIFEVQWVNAQVCHCRAWWAQISQRYVLNMYCREGHCHRTIWEWRLHLTMVDLSSDLNTTILKPSFCNCASFSGTFSLYNRQSSASTGNLAVLFCRAKVPSCRAAIDFCMWRDIWICLQKQVKRHWNGPQTNCWGTVLTWARQSALGDLKSSLDFIMQIRVAKSSWDCCLIRWCVTQEEVRRPEKEGIWHLTRSKAAILVDPLPSEKFLQAEKDMKWRRSSLWHKVHRTLATQYQCRREVHQKIAGRSQCWRDQTTVSHPNDTCDNLKDKFSPSSNNVDATQTCR